MTLLALNQQEILVKLPLKETYLNETESTYSCSTSQRVLLLGVDNDQEFRTINGMFLLPSERYCVFNPQFDFSIFQDSDFRGSNESISFPALRENSITPDFIDLAYRLEGNTVGYAYRFKLSPPFPISIMYRFPNEDIRIDNLIFQNLDQNEILLPDVNKLYSIIAFINTDTQEVLKVAYENIGR